MSRPSDSHAALQRTDVISSCSTASSQLPSSQSSAAPSGISRLVDRSVSSASNPTSSHDSSMRRDAAGAINTQPRSDLPRLQATHTLSAPAVQASTLEESLPAAPSSLASAPPASSNASVDTLLQAPPSTSADYAALPRSRLLRHHESNQDLRPRLASPDPPTHNINRLASFSSSYSSSSSSSAAAAHAAQSSDAATPPGEQHSSLLSPSLRSAPTRIPTEPHRSPAYPRAQIPLSASFSKSVSSSPASTLGAESRAFPPSLSSTFTPPYSISSSVPATLSSPPDARISQSTSRASPDMTALHGSPYSALREASSSRRRSGSGSIRASFRSPVTADAEVSLAVLVWWPSTAKSASSTLARAPLFRDAATVKQKLSMRSTSSQSRAAELGQDAVFERASFGFRHGGSSWLREKPSKSRLNSPSSSVGPLGQWKRATLLFRDNGSLSIFGEGNALTHTLSCSALSHSDLRCVDDSLFGRPHVLAVRPRQSRAKTEVSVTTRRQEAALLSERNQRPEPIFIEFKSEEHLHYVRTLILIYARPDIYGSPATMDAGGTHRFFRQLDITISDAKSIMPRWPVELPDPSNDAVPASPIRSGPHPLMQSSQPASPTISNAGATASIATGELPRSLSYQLAALRCDDNEESPGSEPLTEDGLSGSSRAGSMPGSRPGSRPPSRPSSRLRHNAKPSVSSIRNHPDLVDDNAASGSSRPASRTASHYDVNSNAGDDASSNGEHHSGPLSGHAGASRFASANTAITEVASSTNAGISHSSSFSSASRSSAPRRDDKDRFEKARFDRYCRIRLDGELVARTSMSQSTSNAFAIDKFHLKDVGDARSLLIEVLHPTQKSSSSLSSSAASAAGKYVLLGMVEIPIETLRRNEEVDGRFPIWSISTFPSINGADEDDGRVPTSFHRGIVGELSLTIRLHEGAVMPLSMYEEVFRRIHDPDAADMISELSSTMREDAIISHLIRIYAASGTISERISALIEAESANWGEKMEPELLFRANTLLSRSVDHFQRLRALSWLEECLGPTVRKICHDPLAPSRPDTAASGGSAASEETHFDFSTSIRSPPSLPANAIDAIPDGPMTTNSLRKLSETMWQNIYRQRHSCPPDLRMVLYQIRCKVNERYRSAKSTRPGIQGVGAFVFLRLFCAALNAPQLYGLTPSQPDRGAQRKLLLLSKVLLALASKKTAFDKDKDWELTPLSDLLRTYSSAYDDYISVVSTEPPTAPPVQMLGTRIEDDAEMQAAAVRKQNSLSPLHREAIPRAPYMIDQPQALASFVSFVADCAEERERVNGEAGPDDGWTTSDAGDHESKQEASEATTIRQRTHDFVQICCRIEEAAGMYIEQAGYDPRPIPMERLQRAALSSLPRHGGDSASPAPASAQAYIRPDSSAASFSSSTSTFSTVIAVGDGSETSPRSSPARLRNRRATVSAAQTRSRAEDKGSGASSLADRMGYEVDGGSPSSGRRKSFGLARSIRRPSQATSEMEMSAAQADAAYGRRASEVSESTTTTPRQRTSIHGLAPLPPLSAPPRAAHGLGRYDEDDHGSDDELRQAYRMLRAEEAEAEAEAEATIAPPQDASRPPRISTGPDDSDGDGAADFDAPMGPAALGLEPMGALLEADDGSTFEPVYPHRGFAAATGTGPPLSRSARQSMELSNPAAGVGAASRRLSARASFTTGPSKQLDIGAASVSARGGESDAARRHSTDQPALPRNYSLPQPPEDRRARADEARESREGGMVEDAYAQTRAALPASASMPTVRAPAEDAAQIKKKKWWKP